MDTRDLLNLRRNVLSGANRKPAISAFLEADSRTGPRPQQTVQQQPGSVVENARQRALMALGASPKPDMGIPQARLVKPTTAASGLGSMLPGRGTPGSAALGAFGQTMSQLGGWQDKPMTFGQILGASLGKAREAYGTAEEKQAAIAEKKALLEKEEEETQYTRKRQSMLDAIAVGNFNIARRKAAREEAAAGQPTKPYEIYDVKTGRKKFVRDVRTEEGGWSTEDVGGVAAEKSTKDKIYGQKTVYDTKTQKAISVAENDPRIQLGGEFLDSDRYRVSNTPQAAIDAADIGFSDKVKNDLMNKVITLDMTLDNVSELNRLYRDEYQIIPQKAKYLLTLQAEKWGLTDISPDEERAMSGFVQLRQQANTTLNDYIKAITGAQMSVAEAGRLEKSVPKAGTGLFDGDSPTEFKAKLEQFGRLTKLARARNVYALKNGFQEARTESGQLLGFGKVGSRPLTLDRMDQILAKETRELAKDYRKENDDMSEAQALIQAKSIIEERYGINV
jgi:hypothetical protein